MVEPPVCYMYRHTHACVFSDTHSDVYVLSARKAYGKGKNMVVPVLSAQTLKVLQVVWLSLFVCLLYYVLVTQLIWYQQVFGDPGTRRRNI